MISWALASVVGARMYYIGILFQKRENWWVYQSQFQQHLMNEAPLFQ